MQAPRLPASGEPGSVVARVNDAGKVKQVRVYDESGNAAVDIDRGHPHHGAGEPHYHPWPNGERHPNGLPFREN